MSQFALYSDTANQILKIRSTEEIRTIAVLDSSGSRIPAPFLCRRAEESWFDGSALLPWSPDEPVLYHALINDAEKIRFGFTSITAEQDRMLKLNDAPFYARGYIRGIIAHDHPNMTGGSEYDAAVKNIRQAKKYGFNLVRFHSTIPTEEFVRAAEDLGMLIHMEIGFTYQYRTDGSKENLKLDDTLWQETILHYRNSPAVAIFCIGNEMHNSGRQPEARRLYEIGKKLAPGKLIMDNSGWGEYDRSSADVFSQHIAYFFPFGTHKDMFFSDACWHKNGSAGGGEMQKQNASAVTRRFAAPLRPVLAHEAVHYIEMPDYDALNAKFDAFAARVGDAYLQENNIQKPKFMTELPRIIREKGLLEKMPDYQAGSFHFKKIATKLYLERMRLAPQISGFEMLQFADCFKYENKNGIVDCFDDDKGFDPGEFRQSNDASVLLCDLTKYDHFCGRELSFKLFLSHYAAPENQNGKLTVRLISEDAETILEEGSHYITVPGVHELIRITLPAGCPAGVHEIAAEFVTDSMKISNRWKIWCFDPVKLDFMPQLRLADADFANFIRQGAVDASASAETVITDRIDESLFDDLAAGKTVLLCYHKEDDPDAKWKLPGSFDRFKPCIWDRGTHLGGILYDPVIRKALGNGKYLDLQTRPLVDGAFKVNLDDFPARVLEMISIIDKPVRDRMNSLKNIKEFQKERILRNFSSLFAVRCGKGLLVVSTFSKQCTQDAAAGAYYSALVNMLPGLQCADSVEPEALQQFMAGVKHEPEDVMTRFWEMDNKSVEDVLFWEEMGIDLRNLKR